MAIEPKFSLSDFQKSLKTKIERIERVVLLNLQRVGEQFVRDARLVNTYKDRTGNLRSSIGYIILKDGQQLVDNFKIAVTFDKEAQIETANKKKKKVKADGRAGMNEGKELAQSIGEKYPRGFVLICVAGMNYAAAVESKSFDVITASSIEAQEELKIAFARIKKKTA